MSEPSVAFMLESSAASVREPRAASMPEPSAAFMPEPSAAFSYLRRGAHVDALPIVWRLASHPSGPIY